MDCHLLSHGISIEKDIICDCCLKRGENDGKPFLIDIRDNFVDWTELFKRKINFKKTKIEDEKYCKGCLGLEDKDFNDGEYISYINFNHWNRCNSKCIYCCDEFNGGNNYFNVLPIIKDLIESGYFKNNGEITFQGGEPTILPEFEDLLELFIKEKSKIRIHSSGIKYSEAIEKALSKGLVTVVISPDSGNPETYRRIKTVPCFDRVWQNIKNYAASQNEPDKVKVKYIIIPGINDYVDEVDKWFEKCLETHINNIIIDVEFRFASENNYKIPHVCMLIDYIIFKAEQLNLKHEFYNGAFYADKEREFPELSSEIMKNKSVFLDKYSELQEKYKFQNLIYK